MTRLAVLLLLLILSPLAALAADDTCQILPGETLALGKRCSTVSTLTNIATGTTVERSLHVNGSSSTIVGVLLSSTNCTDCDIVIADASCTVMAGACTVNNTADQVVFAEDAILAQTFYGVAYSQHLYYVPPAPLVVMPTTVSGERRAYVRVTNNDPSSDDDVIVTITWQE